MGGGMASKPGFWCGETLQAQLGALITPFDPDQIDCSAYTLTMGRELYVSPSDQSEDPQSVTIRRLDNAEGFTIPPGQFGFLLTEEIVEIPDNALAFISIKAKIKWRGLINVSGFHVDPGFKGRLVFSVYNAGPVPVHLRQGQPLFLIWFANLDRATKLGRNQPVQESFPPDLIPAISGELQSLAGINKKIKDLDKDLAKRVHDIEREHVYYRLIAILVLLFMGAMITGWVRSGGIERLMGTTAASAATAGAAARLTQTPLEPTPGAGAEPDAEANPTGSEAPL